jgi:hypothetical protein
MKTPKFLQTEKKIWEFEKMAIIYSVAISPSMFLFDAGNSSKGPTPRSDMEVLVETFRLTIQSAWKLFKIIMKVVFKFLKTHLKAIVRAIISHPYLSGFFVFITAAMLLLNHLAAKFGRKILWYHYLLVLILGLLGSWLIAILIQNGAFNTIMEVMMAIIAQVGSIFRPILPHCSNERLEDGTKSVDLAQLTESSKINHRRAFIIFSAAVGVVTKVLLARYKRQLVGDGPLTSELVEMIDQIDVTKYFYFPPNLVDS